RRRGASGTCRRASGASTRRNSRDGPARGAGTRTACRWRRARSAPSGSKTRRGARRVGASCLLFGPFLPALKLGLARRLGLERAGTNLDCRFEAGEDHALVRNEVVDELERAGLFRAV